MSLDYLYVFAQSNLIEIPVYWLFYRRGTRIGAVRGGWLRVVALVTLANAVTHPIVFFGFMGLGLSFAVGTLLAEVFAVVVEALLDRRFGGVPTTRAFAASLFANLASWQLAPTLTYLVWFRM